MTDFFYLWVSYIFKSSRLSLLAAEDWPQRNNSAIRRKAATQGQLRTMKKAKSPGDRILFSCPFAHHDCHVARRLFDGLIFL